MINDQEIEQLSQCSSIDTLESIDLTHQTYIVKRIKYNRNRPRINTNKYLGALAFDVIWEDNSETREPIQNLINIETEYINEYINDILKDYIITAQKYPKNNRCCIMCYKKVYNGKFICKKHSSQYSFLNQLFDNSNISLPQSQ